MLNVPSIVKLCSLEDLKQDSNGWRCNSIFKNTDKKGSMSISSDGVWRCHATNHSGHVVELYAHVLGKPVALARAQLKKLGFLDSEYRPLAAVKRDDLSEEEKKEDCSTRDMLFANLRTANVKWTEASDWRGIPEEVFKLVAVDGSIGFISGWPTLGDAYAFVSTTPPQDGVAPETKGAMLRSTLKGQANPWRSVGNYPIWTPQWIANRKPTVYMVEGQWDALALWWAIQNFGSVELKAKAQVIALCGSKKLEGQRDLLYYFKGKTVVYVPDADNAGEEFLIRTHKVLEGAECNFRLLRLPKGENKKDFNDWWRCGLKKEEFELWIEEAPETVRILGGDGHEVVMDAEYRLKHNLREDALVEVNPDGEPVEIVTNHARLEEPVSESQLLEICKPYPLLYDYMKECVAGQESPPLWHFTSFLVYNSAIMGRRFMFMSGSSDCLYPNIFATIVGKSGLGKSQAMYMLSRVAGNVMPGLSCSESFSAEAFLDEFKECPQKMVVINELSEWIVKGDSNYKTAALKAFMKLYDAHNYSAAHPFKHSFRKNPATINEPVVSILSACTEEQVLMPDDTLRNGFVGRFFYAYGRGYNKRVLYPRGISRDLKDRIQDYFHSIATTPIRDESCMVFSEQAHKLFEKAFKLHDAWEKTHDFSGDLGTHTSRWRVVVMKLAMNFEIMSGRTKLPAADCRVVITEQSLRSALKMAKVYENCFLALFEDQFKSTFAGSMDARIQERIIKLMREVSVKDGVSKTDLVRKIRGLSVKRLDEAIDTLKQAGTLIEKELPSINGRGRKRIVYFLVKEKKAKDYDIDTSESVENRDPDNDGGSGKRRARRSPGNESGDNQDNGAGGQNVPVAPPVAPQGASPAAVDPSTHGNVVSFHADGFPEKVLGAGGDSLRK